MRVPFAPAAFPSVGGAFVVYELHLTNFSANPMTLRRIEVIDAEGAAPGSVAVFEGAQLHDILQPVGSLPPKGLPGSSVLAPRP